MKEKDSRVDCPEQQVILYVEKEDGKYGPVQTGSYLTRNYLDDYELKRKHLEESLKEKIRNNEVSPVYYYMVLEDLTISELSARAGIRKSKVKKHLEPVQYRRLTPDNLKKYAAVFNVQVSELTGLMAINITQ
jgi:hypothetical protein